MAKALLEVRPVAPALLSLGMFLEDRDTSEFDSPVEVVETACSACGFVNLWLVDRDGTLADRPCRAPRAAASNARYR